MRLMRHENIQTTMAYYVSLECDEIAEELWGSRFGFWFGWAFRPKLSRGVNDTTLCLAKGCEVAAQGFEPRTRGL